MSKDENLIRVIRGCHRVALMLIGFLVSSVQADDLNTYDLGLSEFAKINLIHAAVKDKKGFYWIGTEIGLYRYDGRQTIKVHSDKSMPLYNLPITRLKLKGDSIWVGTTNGLFYIDLDDYKISSIERMKSLYVWNISVEHNEIVVTTNKNGAFRLSSLNNQYVLDETFLQQQQSENIYFNKDAAIMDDRKVWLSHSTGLYLYDINTNRVTTAGSGARRYPGDLKDIATDNIVTVKKQSNNLIVVTDKHYYLFNKDYWLISKIDLPCSNESNCTFSKLQIDSHGTIWGRLNLTTVAKVDQKSQSIKIVSNITSIYLSDLSLGQDDELLFFGQHSMGAARVGQALYEHVALNKTDPSLASFMPTSYQQDEAGNVWLNNNKVLIEFNPFNKEINRYALDHSPYSFQVGRDKVIWSHDSKSPRIIRFNTNTGQSEPMGLHSVNSIIDSPSDGLWMIDTQFKMYRFNKETAVTTSYPSSFCTNMIKRVYPRIVDQGLLAWSGDGYLCRYNREKDSFDKIKIEGKGKGEFFEKLFFSNEKYWVLSPAIEYYEYDTADKILLAKTFSKLDNIQLDFDGQVISQKHIWTLNQAKTRLYRINTHNNQVSFYNLNEGIPGHTDSRLVGIIKDTQLIFAEPGRISILDISKLDQINFDNSIKIHQATIFQEQGTEQQVFNVKESLELLYTDYSIELSFGSTRPKDKVTEYIYYRLKGNSDNWIRTHRGFVRYSGLGPGRYTFEIKDSLNEKNRKSLAITVEAPPWLRWWAYVIYITFFGAILLSFLIQRIRHHRELNQLARVDSLTKLPNRHQIVEHMQELSRRNEAFTILFIDLDRFKHVNDSLGHQVGDKLLIQLAKRLQSTLNADSLISRLGGDEFLVVCKCADSKNNAELCAKRLIDTIKEPIALENKKLHISLSIGLANYSTDANTIPLLMARADAAMYEAKAQGGNGWCWYSDALGQASLNALNLESKLYEAVQNKEFTPYYQAKFDMANQTYIGYEALARWQCPKLGLISPVEFIETAEKTGNIIDISWELLHQVCQQIEKNSSRGSALPIAVNISAKQLGLDYFAEKFSAIIGKYNINPKLVELEVTESMLLDNSNNAIKQLQCLKLLGHKIYIDDFGTGYSSLAYLKKLPIHALKIDMMFIKDIHHDESSKDIVSAIIYLAEKMKLEVVAEGVETLEVAQLLKELGCNIVQGFYYSVPADHIAYPQTTTELAQLTRQPSY